MTGWASDDDLFALMGQELFSAVLGDVMDAAGLTRQFLPPQIRPLDPAMRVVGRAMPVLEADCHGHAVAHAGANQPFGLMLKALDDLRPNEIYVCTGGSPTYALWGELMSVRARHCGARGAVLDGWSRDSAAILKLGFPVFSFGGYAQDQGVRGRVIDFRCAIRFANGVVVEPGDILLGDVDGVVVVPRAHEADIVRAALDKARGENLVRQAIEGGMSTQEAFARFGIM